ncbi:VanZ family protein [Sediminicola sp. YIK13]|uniref:VanZ family protein n=1 Tax=Sediminicola sp. YIK13 TaxID=1453352 RepID=UPI0011A400A1|nr:VanZ family protein [Sediminicola sp. YIK13]
MLKKSIFTIAFISWMVFITLLSLFSFSEGDLPEFELPFVDKLVHFIFYFMAALLGALFIRERTKGKNDMMKSILTIVIAVVLYGIIIEVLQSELTVDREGDVFDVMANTIGALVGALAIKLVFSGKRQLKWKN